MLSGTQLWQAYDIDEIKEKVLGQDPILSSIDKKVSPQAVNFILQCLHKNPLDRPTAEELLKSPWFEIERMSAPQETDFNQAFANIFSYGQVDSFTTSVCSIIAKKLMT